MTTHFSKLAQQLHGKDRAKVANNTYLERRGADAIAVKLHATDVVTATRDGNVILNSGGWHTLTTKDRINSFAPVRVCQAKGKWTVYAGQHSAAFADGMIFQPDGTFKGFASDKALKTDAETDKKIKAYARLVSASLPLPVPSAGDCFLCQLREVETGKPLGECNHDTSHLLSHFEENYLVPSLVWRAIEAAGCNPKGGGSFWFAAAFQKDLSANMRQPARIGRIVTKYLRRQFGLA